jgi:hydrogenase maturation protein HypF
VTNLKKNTSETKGVELHIQGIVQGVGFRPFIYNLATQLEISGTVSNTSAGVFIQAAAKQNLLDSFITRIRSEAPPLAEILSIEEQPLDPHTIKNAGFTILKSSSEASASTAIPPDIALCDDCLNELLSADDRRHGYPFINCTNCGPRFTIVETIPYDRPKTSMRVFPMCAACRQEYDNPADRRFHAQPNACKECGPQLSWHDRNGNALICNNPVEETISALNDGKIVAIRGLGGFHLAADGCNENSIDLLRQRKNRPTKPLAIMVKDLNAAAKFCHLSQLEKDSLVSPQHPIVLLSKKEGSPAAANLCPGVGDIGVMLPYTPLHHLLFHSPRCPEALVMTSGNFSGHPICIGNSDALAHLDDIADYFLLHNREILTRVDDSVTKKLNSSMHLFRRARGFTPSPVVLAHHLPPILGCGGGLKSTFSLARNNLAFVSQHIGDLFNLESFEFYTEQIKHHQQVFEIEPEAYIRDLHPDYLSSRFADESKADVYKVQHHHAHAAAVMAEHHLDEPVLAIVLDGTGYGTDGTIWGGEILLSRLDGFERLGHLQNLPLPGGDRAAEEPWRMAISALYQIYGRDCLKDKHLPDLLRTVSVSQREILVDMVENGFNSPATSSCGRLFDAVAALLNLRLRSDYEGHAAMELETFASLAITSDWSNELDTIMALEHTPFLSQQEGKWEIISDEFVKMIVDKAATGVSGSRVALDFHTELICAISKLTIKLAGQYNLKKIVLSGGCMQNRLLMEGLFYLLPQAGLQVYTGNKIPVNDGGISFGQILIGGLQHVSRNSHAGDQGVR